MTLSATLLLRSQIFTPPPPYMHPHSGWLTAVSNYWGVIYFCRFIFIPSLLFHPLLQALFLRQQISYMFRIPPLILVINLRHLSITIHYPLITHPTPNPIKLSLFLRNSSLTFEAVFSDTVPIHLSPCYSYLHFIFFFINVRPI
jgi:hypothetical protein